jgi:hypothetical protein
MRFKKSVKIFPGFRLNFSKSGVGATVGGNGLSMSVGKNGAYLNTSLPGTGLSERTKLGGSSSSVDSLVKSEEVKSVKAGEIKSGNIESMASSSLSELNNTINEAYKAQNDMIKQSADLSKELESLNSKGLFGFKSGSTKERIKEIEEDLAEIKKALPESKVNVDIELDPVASEKYRKLRETFTELSKCQSIWDVTSSKKTDSKSRSGANETVKRKKIEINFEKSFIISCKEDNFQT